MINLLKFYLPTFLIYFCIKYRIRQCFLSQIFYFMVYRINSCYYRYVVSMHTSILTTVGFIVHSKVIKAEAFVAGIYGNSYWSFGCNSNTERIHITRGNCRVVAQLCSTPCSFVVTIAILRDKYN